jgi:hypothetical protein
MAQMTHHDAQEEFAVERYLLDELAGEARDRFEDHLFDCTECAADLKAGLLFKQTATQQFRAEAQFPSGAAVHPASPLRDWFSRLFQPLVLAPALAAALCVIAYQSAILLPRVESQLAEARTPAVLNTLVLANAGPRGDGEPVEVVASPGGAYLLSVDLPPSPGTSAYRCTLYGPSGAAIWHTPDIPVAEDKDSITIQVPAAATGPGANLLVVQAVDASHGGKLVDLAAYKFNLRLASQAK